MVYKKFETKGGKVFGPYYYESYRDGDKVKKFYIGGEKEYKEWLKRGEKKKNNKRDRSTVEQLSGLKNKKKNYKGIMLFFIIGIFLLIIGFGIYSHLNEISDFSWSIVGFVINEDSGGLQNEKIIERIDSKDVDLQISEPKKSFGKSVTKNKNKRMEFSSVTGGGIRLYFDLLNYSEFVSNTAVKLYSKNITNITIIEEGIISEINETIVDLNDTINESAGDEEFLNVSNETEISGNVSGISNVSIEQNVTEINETIIESNVSSVVNETIEDVVVSNETADNVVVSNETEEESVTGETVSKETEESEEEAYESVIEETEVEEPVESTETSEVLESEIQPGITGGIIRFFRNSGKTVIGFAGRVVGIDLNELVINESSENEIINEVSLEKIKKDIFLLNNDEIDVISEKSKIVAEDFEIIVNETPDGKKIKKKNEVDKYKWGYNVRLQDLDFMAKIDITAEEPIKILDDESLRIGRKNILSFKDLKDAGYNVRFEEPILEISVEDVEVRNNVLQVVLRTNESQEVLDNESVEIVSNESLNETIEINESNESFEVLRIIPSITGNAIGRLLGFSVKEESEVEDIRYENRIILYIERDFTNSSYKVGDIINLDPEFIIIQATDAEHLDSNREFLSNIYDEIEFKDNNWSEIIPVNDYVRVYFERNLTKEKDISVYARVVDECNNFVMINEIEVPCEIYEKKKRIDELRRLLES